MALGVGVGRRNGLLINKEYFHFNWPQRALRTHLRALSQLSPSHSLFLSLRLAVLSLSLSLPAAAQLLWADIAICLLCASVAAGAGDLRAHCPTLHETHTRRAEQQRRSRAAAAAAKLWLWLCLWLWLGSCLASPASGFCTVSRQSFLISLTHTDTQSTN